jgi:hypothetical protein
MARWPNKKRACKHVQIRKARKGKIEVIKPLLKKAGLKPGEKSPQRPTSMQTTSSKHQR